ncbi:hypothetical protein PRIPAC_79644 [Pristionchus pacificus]|uniref:Uncharacterized protein n=1 Tax=Pristionchus pacificus TaxID=54126 RepID=A0A2A6CKQ9_PRIPA|nr:hypothetical protein PRIPAC_79644 [Pristionchus pacificus]|eukprot:PDM78804.1 hypothetical protein PRIPAC_31383 [Pristionchus pacificus]
MIRTLLVSSLLLAVVLACAPHSPSQTPVRLKQSGADRDISKGGRSERDKQHDVITPTFFLAELVETSVSSMKIKKITELSYFEYHGSDARVWKFHGIGDGDVIKDLKHTNEMLDIKKQGGKLATVNIEDRKRIITSLDKTPG